MLFRLDVGGDIIKMNSANSCIVQALNKIWLYSSRAGYSACVCRLTGMVSVR
jgi:hypothetical protein